MPYKFERVDKFVLKDIKKDRRIKLTEDERGCIRKLHSDGFTIRELSRMFKVSRRLIQFIVYPERLKINEDNFQKRGGWEAQYNKKRHATAMKKHRKYKAGIYFETHKKRGEA